MIFSYILLNEYRNEMSSIGLLEQGPFRIPEPRSTRREGIRAVGLLWGSWGVAAQAGGHQNDGQVRFAGIGYIKTESDVSQNVLMDCSSYFP